MDFDVMESGFNAADETINFGRRSIGNVADLYETATLACLKSSQGEVDSQVSIKAIVKSGQVFFNINKVMRVCNKEFTDQSLQADFETNIDNFIPSSDGRFLLIALRSGTVHLMDTMNNSLIYEKDFFRNESDETLYIGCFLEHDEELSKSFLLVTRTGSVIRLLLNPSEDENIITHEEIFDFKRLIKGVTYSSPYLLINSGILIILNISDIKTIQASYNHGKLVEVDTHSDYFLALDDDGNLVKICKYTLLTIPLKVNDKFRTITTWSHNTSKYIIGWTLPNADGHSYIKLFIYPKMIEEFCIKTKSDICLVQPETQVDETLFVSKIYNDSKLVEIRFSQIYESEPMKRLERLIRKNKFDEAEKLINLFNMDSNLLWKGKAQLIIDKQTCETTDIMDLIKILDAINNDNEFRLSTCYNIAMYTICNNYGVIKEILKYGCSIVPQVNINNKDVIQNLQQNLTDLLFKFDTFMAINPRCSDMEAWHLFVQCDMITELKNYLMSCKIEEAIILYSRLDESNIREITVETVGDLLEQLSIFPVATFSPFLATFIPITLKHQPAALPLLGQWLHNKICQMERSHQNKFPENGIAFFKYVTSFLDSEGEPNLPDSESLQNLNLLINALDGIQTLKSEYGIVLPLNEYLKGPKCIIRHLLNVFLENYDRLLTEYILKLILQNQLDPNKIFLAEIENLMMYHEQHWIQKVGYILDCIPSTNIKLQAIEKILEKAHVPWNEKIRKIARDALKYPHPLVANIRQRITNEPKRVILKRPEYFIKSLPSDFEPHLNFIIKKIVGAGENTMLEDLRQLCTTPEDIQAATGILVDHYVRIGKINEALAFLDNNSPNVVTNCGQHMIFLMKKQFTMGKTLCPSRDNLYHAAFPLYRRLIDNAPNEFEKNTLRRDLENLRNFYNLNKKFGCCYTMDDVLHKKLEIQNRILEEITQDGGKNMDIIKVINDCNALAKYLSLNEDEVLLKLCENLKNFDVIYQSALAIYNTDASCKVLCHAAVFIFKYIGVSDCDLSNDSFDVDCTQIITMIEVDSTRIFLDGLRLAKKMCIKAMMKATDYEKMAVLEVMQWVDSCFYLTRIKNNELREQLFPNRYDENQIVPGYSTFLSIRNIFEAYAGYVAANKNPSLSYITYFNQGSQEDLIHELRNLPKTVDHLCREGYFLTAIQLLTTLQKGLVYVEDKYSCMYRAIHSVLIVNCVPKLLKFVMAAKHLDRNLFNQLLSFFEDTKSVEYTLAYLKINKKHPLKLWDITKAAINYFKGSDKVNAKPLCATICHVKWWRKIKNCPISYDNFFKMHSELRLEQLITANCMNEETISEYCKDYNLSVEKYNLLHFKYCLLNWKPEYEVSTDVYGQKVLTMKSNENMLFDKVNNIMKNISNKNSILNSLAEIREKINFYYYEVLLTIMKINALLTNKPERKTDQSLLMCLKVHQRHSPPSQNEREQWFTAFPDVQTIDPLSEFRLPFISSLFTADIWQIIKPEVNLKTYHFWFKVSSILKSSLTKDDICCYVITELVSSGVLGKTEESEWNLFAKHTDLLAEIDACLKHCSDLEKRSASIYHLMVNTPKGADLVAAVKTAYKYALEYKEKNPDSKEVDSAFTKVEKRYYNLSASHILHVYQLNEDKYMQLIKQPEELLTALYMDERILKKAKNVIAFCPDVCKATEELAEIFKINITKFRYEFCNNLLMEGELEFDNTIVLSNYYNYGTNASLADENLNRVAYICKNSDLSFWKTHWFREGMDEKNENKNDLIYQTNALKCFCIISEESYIKEKTGLTRAELLYHTNKLTLLNQLQRFGFTLDMDSLNAYDKNDLLKRLAKECVRPVGVNVMANICILYDVNIIKYWKFIVSAARKLKMFTELRMFLEILKNKNFQYQKIFISAWQDIIEHSFQIPSGLTAEAVNNIYIKNILMIQACPVLNYIDFEEALNKCLKSGKYEFAALLLPYLPKTKEESYLKVIVNSDSLLSDLHKLQSHGICVQNVKFLLGSYPI